MTDHDVSEAVLSIADMVRARANDDNVAVRFGSQSWTYREWVQCCADRASLWDSFRDPNRPPNIGVLLDNVPDFTMWLGAAALSGSTVVGINPTRRGTELAADIAHTECQIVVTESTYRRLLAGLDLGIAPENHFDIDSGSYADLLAAHRGATLPAEPVAADSIFLLLFTSGTSGSPKAVICTNGRLVFVSQMMVGGVTLTGDDVTYISMPLFHSNALFTAWAPSVLVGATVALRRKFSASEFLADVRRFSATYFNYVGKPLAYILATPEQVDDAENPLTRGFGNEANDADIARFSKRFGCRLIDGYGQTETGASIVRVPDMPIGALGIGAPTVKVLDPLTGNECPPARFDTGGRLLNASEAIGEITNSASSGFEGYWNNPEANAQRVRNGTYFTGDLAYRDSAGFFYFAGRNADWIRVDGENFAAAPVERILARFPGVVLGAVYGVPDPVAGDRVMATFQLTDGASFDPEAFASFLTGQSDLGSKWSPSFVRVTASLPTTATNKVLKRQLVRERWETAEPVWIRTAPATYRRFTSDDLNALNAAFEANGRRSLLGEA